MEQHKNVDDIIKKISTAYRLYIMGCNSHLIMLTLKQ